MTFSGQLDNNTDVYSSRFRSKILKNHVSDMAAQGFLLPWYLLQKLESIIQYRSFLSSSFSACCACAATFQMLGVLCSTRFGPRTFHISVLRLKSGVTGHLYRNIPTSIHLLLAVAYIVHRRFCLCTKLNERTSSSTCKLVCLLKLN